MDIWCFYIPIYIFINMISFSISFIIFFIIAKKEYKIIDIIYSYLFNIIGMIIGAKIIAFVENANAFNIESFFRSGFSFIGAIMGGNIFIKIYSIRYNLQFNKLIEKYYIIYPLIYSISKIGCYISGCCNGTLLNIPMQLIESIIIFGYFLIIILLMKKKDINIKKTLMYFFILKFVFDFYRDNRKSIFIYFSKMQIICILLILYFIVSNRRKKYESKEN